LTEIQRSKINREIAKLDRQIEIIWWLMPCSIITILIYGDLSNDEPKYFKLTMALDTYLSITGGIIATVIGLAIPISLSVIQMIQVKYKTPKLTKAFITEPLYVAQIVLLLLNIFLIVFVALFSIKYMWIVCLVIFSGTIICFSFFLRMIHKYVSDLEGYLGKKYKNKMIDYFER